METMSSKDAMMFPIVGSCVLFELFLLFKFFAKEYLNMLFVLLPDHRPLRCRHDDPPCDPGDAPNSTYKKLEAHGLAPETEPVLA